MTRAAANAPDDDTVLERFIAMAVIREFELRVGTLYRNAEIPGFIHTSLGQEAVAVGVCAALHRTDFMVTTHRGHGHVLAKGAEPKLAMAELFGKATGMCKGKGGSMHIADGELGIIGANAIVGASIPLGIGAALAGQLLGKGQISAAFFGDGAVNQGSFHEALNLATIWQLPAILVCENNTYSEFTDSRQMTRRASTCAFAQEQGCYAQQVDGNDVEAVFDATRDAVERCSSGAGPVLLEALTYRWMGHYEGDPQKYKPEDEATAWKRRDPLAIARERIIERGLASQEQLDEIQARARARIDDAEEFARQSPYPDLEEIWTDVYHD